MSKLPLLNLLSSINEYGTPLNIGKVNNSSINLIKVKGNITWHFHPDRDKMLVVIKGEFKLFLDDREIILHPQEGLIIPRGVLHSGSADTEAWVFMVG
ncbi:cupin domain-containing protein [Candidatus Paracaedibacter symbiosus]|uniref:cupin domain-containing protein n=1 Tax=Candidatus Paracaedibacter symbiosus TaxID=244582 RepID=UPI0005095129|nr:cupin domain-containing protein [Candidatus Paracaedibacter symbiosus]